MPVVEARTQRVGRGNLDTPERTAVDINPLAMLDRHVDRLRHADTQRGVVGAGAVGFILEQIEIVVFHRQIEGRRGDRVNAVERGERERLHGLPWGAVQTVALTLEERESAVSRGRARLTFSASAMVAGSSRMVRASRHRRMGNLKCFRWIDCDGTRIENMIRDMTVDVPAYMLINHGLQ